MYICSSSISDSSASLTKVHLVYIALFLHTKVLLNHKPAYESLLNFHLPYPYADLSPNKVCIYCITYTCGLVICSTLWSSLPDKNNIDINETIPEDTYLYRTSRFKDCDVGCLKDECWNCLCVSVWVCVWRI